MDPGLRNTAGQENAGGKIFFLKEFVFHSTPYKTGRFLITNDVQGSRFRGFDAVHS